MKKEKAPRQRGSTNAPKNVTRRRFKSNREQRIAARMLFTALLGDGLDAERFNRVGAIWAYSDSAFEGPGTDSGLRAMSTDVRTPRKRWKRLCRRNRAAGSMRSAAEHDSAVPAGDAPKPFGSSFVQESPSGQRERK